MGYNAMIKEDKDIINSYGFDVEMLTSFYEESMKVHLKGLDHISFWDKQITARRTLKKLICCLNPDLEEGHVDRCSESVISLVFTEKMKREIRDFCVYNDTDADVYFAQDYEGWGEDRFDVYMIAHDETAEDQCVHITGDMVTFEKYGVFVHREEASKEKVLEHKMSFAKIATLTLEAANEL